MRSQSILTLWMLMQRGLCSPPFAFFRSKGPQRTARRDRGLRLQARLRTNPESARSQHPKQTKAVFIMSAGSADVY